MTQADTPATGPRNTHFDFQAKVFQAPGANALQVATETRQKMTVLAREFPHLGYVKEESQPLVPRMKEEVRQRPPMKAVFGANLGANWLYEMRLGLDGVITGNAMYADAMARMGQQRAQQAQAGQAPGQPGPGNVPQLSPEQIRERQRLGAYQLAEAVVVPRE